MIEYLNWWSQDLWHIVFGVVVHCGLLAFVDNIQTNFFNTIAKFAEKDK
jgi:hypothetical protein